MARLYLAGMGKAYEFCLPTRGTVVPAGPDWLHEIKYDGYRMLVQRESDRVRLLTMNGNDWADRYPWIVETARKIRQTHFAIDGEAVVLGVDGVSDFDALQSRNHDDEVQLYAFDLLAADGDDMRALPLSMRKTNLARLLRGRPEGIFVGPFEQGESLHSLGQGQEPRPPRNGARQRVVLPARVNRPAELFVWMRDYINKGK